MLIERKIGGIKESFGREVYDCMAAEDKAATERLFYACRERVRELEGEIAAKRATMEALKPGSTAADGGSGGGGGGGGEAGGAAWGAPPQGPPPGVGPPLPEGWKRVSLDAPLLPRAAAQPRLERW